MENRLDLTASVGMRSNTAAAPAAAAAPPPLKKDRHIVSWTPEEDDQLRYQVSIHGTDNWTSIAAQFKDKTSRQCRRRWYTYLNSEGKKGGWSPEEDMILCEAQKIFGNRWTEIAKVVSGRTDNAVKNRFSTLCKKRAKHEALSKENNGSCVNPNNKRIIIQDVSTISGSEEPSAPIKQIRYKILDLTEKHNPKERLPMRHGMGGVQLRSPLSVLSQNVNSVGGLPTQYQIDNNYKAAVHDVSNDKFQGTFLKRDDPKLTVLLQQAELLSSLALKVNLENTNQSLEDAWKELQDYLIQTEASGMLTRRISGMDFLLDDFKDLIEELKSNSTGGQLSWRQPDQHEESQGSSEYSTGSIHLSQGHTNYQHQIGESFVNNNSVISCHNEDELCPSADASHVGVLSSSEEPKEADGNICTIPNSEFNSPLQMVPTFQSFTEGIPSPKFSDSERQFLLSMLGMSSPAPSPSSTQPPSCKRVLLDSLGTS